MIPKKPLNKKRRENIEKILGYLQELMLQDEKYFKIKDLADYLNLSLKMTVNYLKIFVISGTIQLYYGKRFSINREMLNQHIKYNLDEQTIPILFSPNLKQMTLEEWVINVQKAKSHEILGKNYLSSEKINKFFENIVERMINDVLPINFCELAEKLSKIDPSSIADKYNSHFKGKRVELRGNFFINKNFTLRNSDNHTVLALAHYGRNKIWNIPSIGTLIPVLISTVGFVKNYFDLVPQPAEYIYPEFNILEEEQLPFHELITEFGSLRDLSVRLAVTLLAYASLYNHGSKIIDKYRDKLDYVFVQGSILPHNFNVAVNYKDESFYEILKYCSNSFQKFVKSAFDYEIPIIGSLAYSTDSIISEILNKNFMDFPDNINDTTLLSEILRSNDATCLIQDLTKRKPRPYQSQNWKFYLKKKTTIAKYEFICKNSLDPLEIFNELAPFLQKIMLPRFTTKKLAHLVLNGNLGDLTFPKQTNEFKNSIEFSEFEEGTAAADIIYSPACINWALERAITHIKVLENIMDEGFRKMSDFILQKYRKTIIEKNFSVF